MQSCTGSFKRNSVLGAEGECWDGYDLQSRWRSGMVNSQEQHARKPCHMHTGFTVPVLMYMLWGVVVISCSWLVAWGFYEFVLVRSSMLWFLPFTLSWLNVMVWLEAICVKKSCLCECCSGGGACMRAAWLVARGFYILVSGFA